jgi:peptidyl-prolyl cis-trans isomerase-like 4
MSVLLETSLGDLVIDVYSDATPETAKNFLKLCKIKYYNSCLIHEVHRGFLLRTGDPGNGGSSVYGLMYGEKAKYFPDEVHPKIKHVRRGQVGMASTGPNRNGSQFYITFSDTPLDYLDGKHTIFGEVAEGDDTLDRIEDALVQRETGRPLQNIRIRHAVVLDDPFTDPPALKVPSRSPSPVLDPNETFLEVGDPIPDSESAAAQEAKKKQAAASSAVVLEMIGDIPDADIRPPDNVLFVCKLHPLTEDEDLELIFSRFGNVLSASVVRDWKTGDSLQYAFIEFEKAEDCEEAYLKMDNVLINDRRIHVDFSQSVARLPDTAAAFIRKQWGGQAIRHPASGSASERNHNDDEDNNGAGRKRRKVGS